MQDYAAARRHMVDSQIRPNKVTDERIMKAMGKVPREIFVPPSLKGVAYVDEDIQIAPGRFLMEPQVLARLIQAAEIEPTDAVLEIGSATGYASAILSHLAESVVAVESDPQLAEIANKALAALEITNVAVVETIRGKDRSMWSSSTAPWKSGPTAGSRRSPRAGDWSASR